MVIFPLAPDQTIAQMWSNGAGGGRQRPLLNEACCNATDNP